MTCQAARWSRGRTSASGYEDCVFDSHQWRWNLKKIEFVIFLSQWSLGSEIRRLAFSDKGNKQDVMYASCAR
jgi:hypothetical protein